jgi:hypothetical protein
MSPHIIGITLLALAASPAAAGDAPQEVVVVNFPETQAVTGKVKVEGRLEAARFVSFESVTVPPSTPDNPARMISLGVIDATGFRALVASVTGSFAARPDSPKTLGLLLVPDEEPFVQALLDKGKSLLSARVDARLAAESAPFFSASAKPFDLAFPRYRAFLFNTWDRSVEASVYLYLTD